MKRITVTRDFFLANPAKVYEMAIDGEVEVLSKTSAIYIARRLPPLTDSSVERIVVDSRRLWWVMVIVSLLLTVLFVTLIELTSKPDFDHSTQSTPLR
jgi:hypothetical protein